jgi:hypothetical protein
VAFLTVMTVLAAAFYNLLGRPDRGVKISLAPLMPAAVEASASNGNGNGNGNGSETLNGASANGNGDGGESTRRRRFVRFRSLVDRQRAG